LAEISLLNAGEPRTDILPPSLTVEQTRSLLRFGKVDTLFLVNVTGSRLIIAMERGIAKVFDDAMLPDASKSMGSYPYAAGMRFDVNMSMPTFHRISNVQVDLARVYRFHEHGRWRKKQRDRRSLLLDEEDYIPIWAPIDMEQTYRVVTNSYLADGGDSYHELTYDIEDLGISTMLAFVEYCQHVGVLRNPPLDEYSTQHYTHDPILVCDHDACL